MKVFWRVVPIVLGLAVIAAAWYVLVRPDHSANLKIGQAEFAAKIMVDERDREKGLSGSQPLGDNEAMLFVFPSDSTWGIWMKDMKYPIDIVWLDKDKTVKHIVENAQPSSYPTIFRPAEDTRYVLEMKAGTTKHKSITIGSRAEFTLP